MRFSLPPPRCDELRPLRPRFSVGILYGWYFIRCARDGAFSLRWCKQVGPKVLSFEAGWLLDVYVKDAQYAKQALLATFQFQPQIKTAKA